MFWNRKKKLLGNDVEPDCAYCAHAAENGCALGAGSRPCGRFRYDPLRRTPEAAPPLKPHDPDEFKL